MSAPECEFRASRGAGRSRSLYAAAGKRLFDVVAVVLMAPVAVPVVALAALAVAAGGGRPFYAQDRVGRGGRPFRCLKLRTMVPDAERRLSLLLAQDPALALEWERKQKLGRDPRVTTVGAFLRRTSLDELPQLWNVLRGHMSLVGPRPILPEQSDLYRRNFRSEAYFRMRPGITGSWQVRRRNGGGFSDRAAFDSDYHARIGIGTDLAILVRTVGAVLRATGQ